MNEVSGFYETLGVSKLSLFDKIRNSAHLRERMKYAESTVAREIMLYKVRIEIDHRIFCLSVEQQKCGPH